MMKREKASTMTRIRMIQCWASEDVEGGQYIRNDKRKTTFFLEWGYKSDRRPI